MSSGLQANYTLSLNVPRLPRRLRLRSLQASDGSPEVFVYVRNPGGEARGAFYAWSANRKKSLSDIHLQELPANDPAMTGHQGKDEYAVVGGPTSGDSPSQVAKRGNFNTSSRPVKPVGNSSSTGWSNTD